MEYPENLKYTKDHEWVCVVTPQPHEGAVENGIATVGITEFAQHELGEVVFVDLPAPGKSIKQGETVCVVESTKAASDVYSPVTGVVKEVNTALTQAPNLINSNPYQAGWMVKLEKINEADLAKLMSASQYRDYLGDKA